jgi:hypothetical protein
MAGTRVGTGLFHEVESGPLESGYTSAVASTYRRNNFPNIHLGECFPAGMFQRENPKSTPSEFGQQKHGYFAGMIFQAIESYLSDGFPCQYHDQQ